MEFEQEYPVDKLIPYGALGLKHLSVMPVGLLIFMD